MTKQETIKLFALISAFYPKEKAFSEPTQEMVRAWNGMLSELSADLAVQAVQKHAASSPFPPSIAEIRKHSIPQMRTGDEAWAIARTTMCKVGWSVYPLVTVIDGQLVKTYPIEEARRTTPPDVWEVMERMGYKDMCLSENMDVLRGQFLRMWDSYSMRKTENAVLPEGLKKLVLEQAERMLLDDVHRD